MALTMENLVMLDVECTSKKEVIEMMAKKVADEGIAESYEEYLQALMAREAIAATAVGYDVGLPHGKSTTVKTAAVAFARLKNPVLWSEEENEYAKMVFMLAIPDGEKGTTHINILVDLSKKILDDDFRAGLEKAETTADVVKLINE